MAGASSGGDDPLRLIITLEHCEKTPSCEKVAKPSGSWSSIREFFSSGLGLALLTFLFTGVIGGAISNSYANHQREVAEYSRRVAESKANRRELIESFSKTYAARRTTLGLVRAIIQSGGEKTERDARWAAYQQAYTEYSLNNFKFIANLIDYLGFNTSNKFQVPVRQITDSFSRLDACVTRAYRLDVAGRSEAARAQLSHCQEETSGLPEWTAVDEMKTLNSCIRTVEMELASSIYLENRFEQLDERRRNVKVIRLIDDPSIWKPVPGRAARPVEFKIADLKGENFKGRVCTTADDWVCWRLLNRQTLKTTLGAEVCASLGDRNRKEKAAKVLEAKAKAEAAKSGLGAAAVKVAGT